MEGKNDLTNDAQRINMEAGKNIMKYDAVAEFRKDIFAYIQGGTTIVAGMLLMTVGFGAFHVVTPLRGDPQYGFAEFIGLAVLTVFALLLLILGPVVMFFGGLKLYRQSRQGMRPYRITYSDPEKALKYQAIALFLGLLAVLPMMGLAVKAFFIPLTLPPELGWDLITGCFVIATVVFFVVASVFAWLWAKLAITIEYLD